jgi:hypothetical protein
LTALLLVLAWPDLEPHASPTAPALALSRADATRGQVGVLVRVEGVFPDADLLQQPYEMQLSVREVARGTRFVCFALSRGVFAGETDAIANGLDEDSVWDMMAAARPIDDGRILQLAPGRIEVLLPASFPSGPAEATLFVIYQGAPVFSNPVLFSIPDTGEAP